MRIASRPGIGALLATALAGVLFACKSGEPSPIMPVDTTGNGHDVVAFDTTDIAVLMMPDCVDDRRFIHLEGVFYDSREVFDTLRGIMISGCPDTVLPDVDFSRRTVVGRFVRAWGCCRPLFEPALSLSRPDSFVVVRIRTRIHENCLVNRNTMIWLSIPKVPADFRLRVDTTYSFRDSCR